MTGIAASLRASWTAAPPALRRRLVIVYAFLLALNAGTWAAVAVAALRYPLLLGLGVTAYGFGLRHAVDPDHIAAIDNTTRKLMQDGKRPVAVGLFFSLGHSAVVVLLSVLVALSTAFVRTKLPQFTALGTVVGTSISGLFLLVVAAINIVVLADVVRTWRAEAAGRSDGARLEEALCSRGLLARILRPPTGLVGESWQMFPIGVLFGLGFDTASEIGLLGIAAVSGANGMPIWLILLLPLLFVAGMSLVDTTDGVAMLGAYGWAFIRPIRKLYYNVAITAVSVLVALLVGGIEVLQVVGTELHAGGVFWETVGALSLPHLGFAVIGILPAGWLVSVLVYKLRRLDERDMCITAGALAEEAGP